MKKTNKLISVLLVLAMMITMAPISAFAATEAYSSLQSVKSVSYSNNVTIYFQENNYLYKLTYTNLKNVKDVELWYDNYNQLRLSRTDIDSDKSYSNLMYKSRSDFAYLGDLPKTPGGTLSCLTHNDEIYIDGNKPVVIITCLAVNAPAWTWNGTSSATAKFTSTYGKTFANAPATISQKTLTEATDCTIKEQVEYKAAVTFNGQTYTNTKTVTGAAGPHSSVYSASENVVVETCSVCTNPIGTLTISAPADLYADGVTAKEAVIDNQLVKAADYTVTYSTADGNAPTVAGTYTASVTIGGATASVEFTLLNYAAKVTDEDGNLVGNYKTFADAVTAAQENEYSTLTLLDDITVAQEQDIKSGKFTLDLNGKNLVSESGRVIELFADVVLTIKDSGEGGTIEAKRGVAKAIINKGTLTVESGTVKGDGGIDNYGTLTFNNGTVEAGEYGAISNFNMAYVYDGVLRSSGSAAFNNYSTAYVYGGEISGVLNEGTAYISGGKIFRNNYAAFNLHAGTVEITGGSFSGTPYGEWTVCYTEGVNLILKGGEFPNGFVVNEITANEFLADGYHFRNEQGKVVDGSSRIIKEKVIVEKGADFSADAVVNVDNVVYNGAAQEPTVTVTVGGKTLTEGKDYTLAFANNINAGMATVTVTGAGDYEGEIVKTFEIAKADSSVDVYPEANELTYNGEAQSLVTAGSSESGTVVYSLDGAEYSETIPTGINADKYTVYYKVEGDSNHNDSEPATVTVTIKAKDISDGFIILGDALTYNGTEQTQTVAEFVIPEDLEVTYTVSGNKATNVGVYLLTVTGTGNFTGEAKITFEIAVDMNGVDFERLYWDNVKSTDKARVEYIYVQIDNAVTGYADKEKRDEWNRIKDNCNELLIMIENVASHLEWFKKEVASYNFDTVTSDDNAYLEECYESEAWWLDLRINNYTEEEYKEFSDALSTLYQLTSRIWKVSVELDRIDEAVNAYDINGVTSADKADVEQLKTDIKALAEGQNLTDEEREHLAELDAKLDAILKKIADTKAEIDRVNEAVNAYDEETIKSTDSADLEQLKEDIQALIDSGNVTETEKTALEEILKDIEALEERITETEEKLEEIKGIESNYNPENVSSDDKAAIENKIAEIEAVNPDNLTNEQKAEYDEIKAGFEALLEEIEKAGSEVDAIGAELEMFNEERVTIFSEDEIEALKAKIEELLADTNMGEAEKAKLNEYMSQAEKLIEIINTPAEYFAMRIFYFIWDALNWLVNHVVFIFNWIF